MESNESSFNPSSSSVVQITQSNFDSVLASNEVVFVFTYFEGFKYCTRIMPKFEQAAKELTEAGTGPGKAVMAKLDYRKADTITAKFQFHFYPDLKLFRNGLLSRHYYRGERTVEGFVEFVKKQLSDPIIPFSHLNELHDLSEDEGHIIAYLDSRDQPEYDVLRKVASNLREDYRFYVKFGDSATQMKRTGQKQLSVVFRSTTGIPVELDETYHGSLLSVSDIISCVKQKCFPFLREITSENEDILRNVGSPVVILIHMPSDTESVKKYKEAISIKEWKPENHQSNFLIADGTRLETLLVHFDKSISDLPLIAISYYSTVNLYDFNVTEKPGKLKEIFYEAYSSEFFHQGIDLYRLCVIIDYTEEEYHICGLFE